MNLIGKKIRIIYMPDEEHYNGRVGIVRSVDSMGQLHGSWGGLAIQTENDMFEVIEEGK